MVECGCWVVVMVCGRPGMFVVVEVMCGRHGGGCCGMKKEAVSPFVTPVTFGSRTHARAHARARARAQIHTIYNFIASIIQFCNV